MPTLKRSPHLKTPARRQTAAEFLELQRLMAGTVMQPLTPAGNMRPTWQDGCRMQAVAAEFIKANDRLTSFERLEIYNRQYWYRLKDCFFEDYPGLRAILGPDRFERMAIAYLAQCPSESFTLRNLGRRLVAFLEANPRWIKPFVKPALDMARLEWAHIEAFDNEAKPRLQLESLSGADPESIHLELQPHLSLLQLGYELDKLLLKAKSGQGLRDEASNASDGKRAASRSRAQSPLKAKTIFLAVHRANESVFYKRLLPGQFRLLSAFRSGQSLAAACESLISDTTNPVDPSKITEWFQTWAGLGWFCENS
jgi:hypothetical protein